MDATLQGAAAGSSTAACTPGSALPATVGFTLAPASASAAGRLLKHSSLLPSLCSQSCVAGGYLGSDSAGFFSSVTSGAAGSYLTTLTADAGISTELTIRPGQVRSACALR